MPLRCPVCKVENDEGPTCRRCKVDLTTLFELEECRARALLATQVHIVRGEYIAALKEAGVAHRLREDANSHRLLAMAHLLNHKFAAASQNYQTMARGTA